MEFRSGIAEHYRRRGYQVREGVKVRGRSGAVYAVDLVAQGPIGNIVVTFGGLDGLDDADLAQVKRVAKEIGATPVAAAPDIDPLTRRTAGREQVVLLEKVPEPEAPTPEPEPEDDVQRWQKDHPWPSTQPGGDGDGPLRSVALDDLMGADQASPPKVAANEAAAQPAIPAQDRAQDRAKDRERFGWLRPQGPSRTQGGYEFPSATPAARTRPTDAHTAEARQADASGLEERVDAAMRRRDTAPAPAGTGTPYRMAATDPASGADRPTVQGRKTVVRRSPDWVWIVRFGLGGLVAGIVAWLLLRFGP